MEVALLENYNPRLVVLATTFLGIAAGIVGAFLLLRKRSLMGDALAHSTLPGIGCAFIIMVLLGGDGFVLSVFFGAGVAMLGMVQQMPEASAAGLESFIYGKVASMVMADFLLIAGVAVCTTIAALVLFKEFTLLCFDESFASSQGWPTFILDVILLALVTAVTVIGLQAVGLILIIAFLITPASAARFWTDKLSHMVILSASIGAISGWLGASVSALVPRLPAGAMIVLVSSGVFIFSMIFAPRRGAAATQTQGGSPAPFARGF